MSAEKAMKSDAETNASTDYLTIMIADQLFGIPILQVQDVLGVQAVTKIPLSPPEVAGSLNLRGRIVTAIDVRKRLGINEMSNSNRQMSVVVEHEDELYSLIIDSVGDVITLSKKDYERNPATLDPLWRDISTGIYRMGKDLMIVIDVSKLLESVHI